MVNNVLVRTPFPLRHRLGLRNCSAKTEAIIGENSEHLLKLRKSFWINRPRDRAALASEHVVAARKCVGVSRRDRGVRKRGRRPRANWQEAKAGSRKAGSRPPRSIRAARAHCIRFCFVAFVVFILSHLRIAI
jgi:hypothetical protein